MAPDPVTPAEAQAEWRHLERGWWKIAACNVVLFAAGVVFVTRGALGIGHDPGLTCFLGACMVACAAGTFFCRIIPGLMLASRRARGL
jgi:hypothetical protein